MMDVEVYDREKLRVVFKMPNMEYVVSGDDARTFAAKLLKVLRDLNLIVEVQA